MTLRQAVEADASSIAALSVEVWLGTYLKRGISGFFADYVLSEFTADTLSAVINDPEEWIMVSQNEEGIDGFIRLRSGRPAPVDGGSDTVPEPVPDTEIVTFYVQPRHHGRGVGKALLEAALAHCSAQGIPSVWLATNAENTPAIGFYLAQGFKQIGHTHFELEGEAYLNNVYAIGL